MSDVIRLPTPSGEPPVFPSMERFDELANSIQTKFDKLLIDYGSACISLGERTELIADLADKLKEARSNLATVQLDRTILQELNNNQAAAIERLRAVIVQLRAELAQAASMVATLRTARAVLTETSTGNLVAVLVYDNGKPQP